MRADLEATLIQRWPDIFRGRDKPLTDSLMGHGIATGDGWFAILDALCEVLSTHAPSRGRIAPEAVQIKEKFAGLRFYAHGADDWDRGAIVLAEQVSARTCEFTGNPGRPHMIGGWHCTLSPETARTRNAKPLPLSWSTEGMPPLDLPALARALADRWSRTVIGPLDIPSGWADLADVLLDCVSSGSRTDEMATVKVRWLGRERNQLLVETVSARPRDEGAIAYAAALSARIDPLSGAHRIQAA
jgi:hypothetical protein